MKIYLLVVCLFLAGCDRVDIINDTPIADISPSTQTSDEILDIIRNASDDFTVEEIVTGIEQADGNGPFYGADENGSLVFLMFSAEKYFGKNNWVFCHESTEDCKRVVDNSNNQRFTGTTQYVDGKIYMLNFDRRVDPGAYGKTLAYYDTNTREFNQNALDLHGINGGSSMTLGVDGYLYMSGSDYTTSNHYVSYYKVNPNDLNDTTYYTDYYQDLYVDRTRDIAVDFTHVYQAMGDNPWELVAVDKENNTSVKLLDGKFFKLDQLKYGVGMSYTDLDGVDKKAYLYNGQVFPTDSLDATPPWKDDLNPPNNHPRENPTGYWAYREFFDVAPNIGKPEITQLQLSKIFPIEDSLGEVKLGVKIGEKEINFSIMVDTYVQLSSSIRKIDENKMMVIGRSYSGASILYTDDDTTKYLGSYHVSPNVYKTFIDYSDNKKKFLFSGYPSATTAIYTLNETDDKFSIDNFDGSLGYLRKLPDDNNLADGVDIDIHRTTGMVQIGEIVYFIGMQYRSGVGGALISWNTRTGEKKAVRKDLFESYQPRDMIQVGGKLIIATQAVDSSEYGGVERPSTPKVFVVNPNTLTIEKEYSPLEGLASIDSGRIASLDGRHIIGLSNNGSTADNNTSNFSSKTFLYIIDTYTDEIVMSKTIDLGNYMRVERGGSAFIDGFTFVKNGDYIYTWLLARTLSTIDKNGKIESHYLMPYQSKMDFANGYIYLTGDEKIRKVLDPK